MTCQHYVLSRDQRAIMTDQFGVQRSSDCIDNVNYNQKSLVWDLHSLLITAE